MRPEKYPDTSSTSDYFNDSDFRTTPDETSESSPLSPETLRRLRRIPSEERVGDRSNDHSSSSSYDEERNNNVSLIAESLNEIDQSPEIKKYFLGLKTAEEAAAYTTPTSIRLYYQIPKDCSLPDNLPLFLVYQSNKKVIFHFPIIEEAGRWRIQYGESKHVSYPSVHSLLMHHVNYAIVSPHEGELESFEVWKAVTRC